MNQHLAETIEEIYITVKNIETELRGKQNMSSRSIQIPTLEDYQQLIQNSMDRTDEYIEKVRLQTELDNKEVSPESDETISEREICRGIEKLDLNVLD